MLAPCVRPPVALGPQAPHQEHTHNRLPSVGQQGHRLAVHVAMAGYQTIRAGVWGMVWGALRGMARGLWPVRLGWLRHACANAPAALLRKPSGIARSSRRLLELPRKPTPLPHHHNAHWPCYASCHLRAQLPCGPTGWRNAMRYGYAAAPLANLSTPRQY